ncbi:MAG: glycoside hydrolase family 15 protein [Candidatus Korobacteraceae bacterium]
MNGKNPAPDGKNPAPGAPGIEPRWTAGAKDAVGTAYAVSSRLWYTLAMGVNTEVYYPTIDTPQIRDLQYMVSDGETFFHDERRNTVSKIELLDPDALGFKITNTDPAGRYTIEKQIIGDPHLNCLLIHTRFNVAPEWQGRLHLYMICAPHLEIGGWHNNGLCVSARGRRFFLAYRDSVYMAIGVRGGFTKLSVGYVGTSDGWTDLSHNFQMDWEYDNALDGNIALTAEINLAHGNEFTLGVAFGRSPHAAGATLLQSLCIPFQSNLKTFIDQWHRTQKRLAVIDMSPGKISDAASNLFARSINLLLAHEDKIYPGAMIASLSIPWGEDKSDDELGGYHLVWTRDMVHCASALLAAGDTTTPLRAMIYLAITQREDGGFYQSFWIDGDPYWTGVQLDEVSFPIILAWRLWKGNALAEFDPYITVLHACAYLIREGPATPEERWEEAGGYSPSTLASNIAALICAAEMIESRGDKDTADFVRTYADFLESHIEKWTVTNEGTLLPEVKRHYIRINPAISCAGAAGDEDPDKSELILTNQKPGDRYQYPANQIVDHGFLELVRLGIRKPGDPLIEDSLKVVDAVLKVETPAGPCWKRYNHDGYGQRADGTSFNKWGMGHAWPLLLLERATYELAAGSNIDAYLRAAEAFSTGIGLFPEQIWDLPDIPEEHMFFGKATGAAIPLLWAHAEYVTLLRSLVDGKIFDRIDTVAARYCNDNPRLVIEVWKMNRQVRKVAAGALLRIQASSPFVLHWSDDEWRTPRDTSSTPTSLGIEYVDLQIDPGQKAPLRFTFHWPVDNQWQGKDYAVEVEQRAQADVNKKKGGNA